MNITLTQLRYITAVDTHRNFVKAAESCHVTQPTLSMQIQRLEDQIGVKVFDRTRLPVIPTQIGIEIIEQARIILNETAKIEEMIRAMKGTISGQIKIGIIPTLAPYIVPLFAPTLMKKYPEVNLSISEATTAELSDMLQKEQIDCALMASPIINDDQFQSKHLFYETFVGYVHPNNQAFTQNALSISDMKNSNVWLLNDGHCLRNQLISLCKETNDSETRLEYESGSLDSLIRMVDRNGGLTVLPELAVRDLSEKRKSKIRPFEGKAPGRAIKIYTHRSFFKESLINALVQSIKEILPEHLKTDKGKRIIDAFENP